MNSRDETAGFRSEGLGGLTRRQRGVGVRRSTRPLPQRKEPGVSRPSRSASRMKLNPALRLGVCVSRGVLLDHPSPRLRFRRPSVRRLNGNHFSVEALGCERDDSHTHPISFDCRHVPCLPSVGISHGTPPASGVSLAPAWTRSEVPWLQPR